MSSIRVLCVLIWLISLPPQEDPRAEIRLVFEEHGNVVEVFLIKDKRTGQEQDHLDGGSFEKKKFERGSFNKLNFDRGNFNKKHVGGSYTKLFVGGSVPKTAMEENIRPVFEEHGNVVDIVLIKDKRTGQEQGLFAYGLQVPYLFEKKKKTRFNVWMSIIIAHLWKM